MSSRPWMTALMCLNCLSIADAASANARTNDSAAYRSGAQTEHRSAYQVAMSLSLNGQLLSSPRMLIIEGKRATISQTAGLDENTIEVTATEQVIEGTKKAILLDFAVKVVRDNGLKTFEARPRILAVENETASFSIQQNDPGSAPGKGTGPEEISLSVIATRQPL